MTPTTPTTPTTGQCCRAKCPEQGTSHKWGYGFRFCDEHMPTMHKLAAGTLPKHVRPLIVATCVECHHHGPIKGRRLCSPCYERHRAARTLCTIPQASHH